MQHALWFRMASQIPLRKRRRTQPWPPRETRSRATRQLHPPPVRSRLRDQRCRMPPRSRKAGWTQHAPGCRMSGRRPHRTRPRMCCATRVGVAFRSRHPPRRPDRKAPADQPHCPALLCQPQDLAPWQCPALRAIAVVAGPRRPDRGPPHGRPIRHIEPLVPSAGAPAPPPDELRSHRGSQQRQPAARPASWRSSCRARGARPLRPSPGARGRWQSPSHRSFALVQTPAHRMTQTKPRRRFRPILPARQRPACLLNRPRLPHQRHADAIWFLCNGPLPITAGHDTPRTCPACAPGAACRT
jgi:hypothetical protein